MNLLYNYFFKYLLCNSFSSLIDRSVKYPIHNYCKHNRFQSVYKIKQMSPPITRLLILYHTYCMKHLAIAPLVGEPRNSQYRQ